MISTIVSKTQPIVSRVLDSSSETAGTGQEDPAALLSVNNYLYGSFFPGLTDLDTYSGLRENLGS